MFRRRQGRIQHLVLRRAPGRSLPGVWQPVTGGLKPGERALGGALRELHEETGLRPRRLWRLETVTASFDPRRDRVRVIIRFAAEIAASDPVRLSSEHTAHGFVSAREAARRMLWDTQRNGLRAVGRQVIRGGHHARSLEIEIPAARRG